MAISPMWIQVEFQEQALKILVKQYLHLVEVELRNLNTLLVFAACLLCMRSSSLFVGPGAFLVFYFLSSYKVRIQRDSKSSRVITG